jgi:hypothetical protein
VGLLKYVWVHIFLRGPPKKKSFPAGFGKKSAGVSWRGVLDVIVFQGGGDGRGCRNRALCTKCPEGPT